MKAAPFDYVRPRSVEEACACLAADADAAIIAGGQTLVPMMAMRLARPSRLIDIARFSELHGIRDDGAAVAVGATTRQATAPNDDTIARMVPMLALALPFVGHAADPQPRYGRRLDRQCRSFRRNPAGAGDARRR